MQTPSLDELRRQVRTALEQAPAYRALPAERRSALARNLVRTLGYLSDPAAGDPTLTDVAEVMAQGEPAPPPGPRKESVTGKAIQTGADAFEQLTGAVDFPGFVSELIEGVFTSIVDASIRQMEAYGELLSAVVKSTEEFANENFTDNQARDHVRDSFPGAVDLEVRGGQPRLKLKDVDDEQLPDFGRFLGVEDPQQVPGLDDETSEAELVRMAKLKMARSRQQQLATMVVLGINRIIVTDGRINAKVVFDVRMSESSEFKASAAYHDKKTHVDAKSERKRNIWGTKRKASSEVNTRVTTLDANTKQEASESIEAKAKLTGEVTVNFRSETFPLDKLASPDQMLTINSLSENPGG